MLFQGRNIFSFTNCCIFYRALNENVCFISDMLPYMVSIKIPFRMAEIAVLRCLSTL